MKFKNANQRRAVMAKLKAKVIPRCDAYDLCLVKDNQCLLSIQRYAPYADAKEIADRRAKMLNNTVEGRRILKRLSQGVRMQYIRGVRT